MPESPWYFVESEAKHRSELSVFDLAFDNGASKSNSLSVGCERPSNISNKCYDARTDPIKDRILEIYLIDSLAVPLLRPPMTND